MDGTVKDYAVEIESIDMGSVDKNRDMVIQITDPELLNRTNGIVQGMGVIDNMDNTKKPVNTGFSAVTLNNEPNIGV